MEQRTASIEDLKLIIDQTLGMFGYFQILKNLLKSSSPPHSEYSIGRIDEILNSKQFIAKVYPYINSQLTSTNIGIIVETLKIYLYLPTKFLKHQALERIKSTVNIFTIYQLEKNITSFECNLFVLNSVLGKIGLIILEEQFNYYCVNIWNKTGYIAKDKNIHYEEDNHKKEENLSLYEIVPLSVQLETLQEYKRQLLIWISSEQYIKKQRANRQKVNQKNNQMGDVFFGRKNTKKLQKIHIKYMKASELLAEIVQKQMVVKRCHLATSYRDVQKLTKPLSYNQSSCELSLEIDYRIESAKKKSKIQCELQLKTNKNRNSMDKSDHQKKMLNGYFVREGIIQQLESKEGIIIDNFNPNDIIASRSPSDSTNFQPKTNEIIKPLTQMNKKIMNQPFFRMGSKIMSRKY